MPSVNDILRITACQKAFNEEVCNVFYYLVSVWTGNIELEDIVQPFIDTIISGIRPFQHPSLEWTELKIDNVTDGLEFWNEAISVSGADPTSTTMAPSFVAHSIMGLRSDKSTRNGFKRIAGVSEGQLQDNTTTLSTVEKQALSDAVWQGITLSSGEGNFTLSPVIVGRLPSGALDLTRVNNVASAQYRRITTQNTRKPSSD